jgi:hypothetical protein
MEITLSEVGVVEINMIYKTLFFILIATASFSAILFSWHGCFMFLEVKLEKKLKANLLAPFSISGINKIPIKKRVTSPISFQYLNISISQYLNISISHRFQQSCFLGMGALCS